MDERDYKAMNEGLNKDLTLTMPLLPEGLDDDSNCDYNFKLGWIACWEAFNAIKNEETN